MKAKNLFFVALILGVCCCSSKNDGTVSIVDVGSNKMAVFSLDNLNPKMVTIPLSRLVENCSLTQLESDEDAYIHPWFTTITEKYIGVRQQEGRSYMLFDRSGKFLCKVGARGQGPGEYPLPPYDDIIDEKNGLIYLSPFSGNKIFVYDISGKFLRNIVAPVDLAKAKIFLDDNVLTIVHMAFEGTKSMVIQLDVNTGKVLKELPPPTHFFVSNFDGEIFNTRNVSGIFDFLHTNSDTLYQYDMKSNNILPIFTMTYSSSDKVYKQYWLLNNHMILTNIFGRGFVATDLKSMTSSYITIVNDFYGNLPMPATFRNGYFVLNIQPEQLMDDVEKHLAGGSCTEKDKQALKELLSNLEEGANNVVLAGKLKYDTTVNKENPMIIIR